MRIIFTILLLCQLQVSFAQLERDTAHFESGENSVVYFIRNSKMASIVNFSFFDGDQAIGQIAGKSYFRYDCKPGEHIFWAKSENKSFVKADLAPGKVYFIIVHVMVGFIRPNLNLEPIDSEDRYLTKYTKFIQEHASVLTHPKESERIRDDNIDVIDKALKRFDKKESKGNVRKMLYPDMNIDFDGG